MPGLLRKNFFLFDTGSWRAFASLHLTQAHRHEAISRPSDPVVDFVSPKLLKAYLRLGFEVGPVTAKSVVSNIRSLQAVRAALILQVLAQASNASTNGLRNLQNLPHP